MQRASSRPESKAFCTCYSRPFRGLNVEAVPIVSTAVLRMWGLCLMGEEELSTAICDAILIFSYTAFRLREVSRVH